MLALSEVQRDRGSGVASVADAVTAKKVRDLIATALRDHGTPIPDDGYPRDEYDCCAEAVIETLAAEGYVIDNWGAS